MMSEQSSEFKYPKFNQKGKVLCQICGKDYMILTPSHLKTHDLSYSEYKDKFPGAPLTNEEFKALSMYSKPNKYTQEDIDILGSEIVIDDVPVIDDEFELPKNQIAKEFSTPMEAKKYEIFTFLANFFPDIKMYYLIEIFDIQHNLIFSAVSDFADPFLQVNIQFPETFWHNQDANGEDPNRTHKLAANGWKTITVKSNSPSIKAIEKSIRKYM